MIFEAQHSAKHIFNIKIFIFISAASVLRMIFNAFDEKTHILALRDYLQKRKYLTARPTDLWESFESFVSIPIAGMPIGYRNVSIEEIMNTWTDQPGYPVVNATLTDSILTLSQVMSHTFMSLFRLHFLTYVSKIL